MAVVECEDVGQSLPVQHLATPMQSAEDQAVLLAAVPAEVNDVRAMVEQQSLEIAGPCGRIVNEFKTLTVWTFVQSLENFSGLFVDKNPAGVPGIGGQKEYANLF